MRKSLRSVPFIGALSILIANIALPVVAFAAPTPIINEYAVPSVAPSPFGAIAGPDGNMWFTEQNGNKIGKITTSGTITEYPVPTENSGPTGITAGPDGNLWFTEQYGNNIGKITTSGVITEYLVSTPSPYLYRITAGPDGNLWFTEFNGNKIGKINPDTGFVNEYDIPTESSYPTGITAGPDGNLWFTEGNPNQIGKITTSGTITEYPVTTGGSYPFSITPGPDGNMWFAEYGANQIGKITTSGTITEYVIPTSGAGPTVITHDNTGPNNGSGNLWFVEGYSNKIGTITTSGTITEYDIPTPGSYPSDITAGPDGNMWFTEQNGNNIGKITTLPTTGSTVTVAVGENWPNLNYTVNSGVTFIVDGTLGAVTVTSGGILQGTGTVGNTMVNTGGTIAPGHSPGCLNTGNLTLNGTYQFEIGGVASCTGYDQLIVTGTVDVSSGTLSTSLYSGFVPTVGQSYIIIDNDAADAVTGNFTGLPEGSTFTSQGVTYRITYMGGTGNDVVLTVTKIDSSQLPTVPNTGIHPNTTNPTIPLLVSAVTAGTLIYASRRINTVSKK